MAEVNLVVDNFNAPSYNGYNVAVDPTAVIGTHLDPSQPPAQSAWGNNGPSSFTSSSPPVSSAGFPSQSPYAAPSQLAPSASYSFTRPRFTEISIQIYGRIQTLDSRLKAGDLQVINRYQVDEYQGFRAWRSTFQNWDPARGAMPLFPEDTVGGR